MTDNHRAAYYSTGKAQLQMFRTPFLLHKKNNDAINKDYFNTPPTNFDFLKVIFAKKIPQKTRVIILQRRRYLSFVSLAEDFVFHLGPNISNMYLEYE